MNSEIKSSSVSVFAGGGNELQHKSPTTAAERALAEAAERRLKADAQKKKAPVEVGGRDGPDPVRYGDWEKDGIISDF